MCLPPFGHDNPCVLACLLVGVFRGTGIYPGVSLQRKFPRFVALKLVPELPENRKGSGNSFLGVLPAMDNQSQLKRPRILLAEDHLGIVKRVTQLLRTVFDVVGTVHTGLEMVSEAVRLNPDVIVTDISMPELSGIEAAHQLREKGSTAKVVFLTVHSEDEFVDACLAEGALGYVVKAHLNTDLIPAIHAALSDRVFISPYS